jgi:hypothetical protein
MYRNLSRESYTGLTQTSICYEDLEVNIFYIGIEYKSRVAAPVKEDEECVIVV